MARKVKLTWTSKSKNLSKQRVYAGPSVDALALLAEIGATDTSYIDETVSPTDEQTVVYKIVSVGLKDGQEITADSSVITVNLPAVVDVEPADAVAAEVDQ